LLFHSACGIIFTLYYYLRGSGMSIERARAHLDSCGFGGRVLEFEVSTATVELAAAAVGVIPARIVKTLCFKDGEGAILVSVAGDAKIDNRRFKERFGMKPSMLGPEDVARNVGHSVGGVCPFGINEGVPVFIDVSVRRFESVYPAAGSENSCIELRPDELYEAAGAADWVDVCKLPEEQAEKTY
jgi:prolyl-tRNA editing enzyme YbaK/EbsC (Cys-tRNA(Pro) deacylase)